MLLFCRLWEIVEQTYEQTQTNVSAVKQFLEISAFSSALLKFLWHFYYIYPLNSLRYCDHVAVEYGIYFYELLSLSVLC